MGPKSSSPNCTAASTPPPRPRSSSPPRSLNRHAPVTAPHAACRVAPGCSPCCSCSRWVESCHASPSLCSSSWPSPLSPPSSWCCLPWCSTPCGSSHPFSCLSPSFSSLHSCRRAVELPALPPPASLATWPSCESSTTAPPLLQLQRVLSSLQPRFPVVLMALAWPSYRLRSFGSSSCTPPQCATWPVCSGPSQRRPSPSFAATTSTTHHHHHQQLALGDMTTKSGRSSSASLVLSLTNNLSPPRPLPTLLPPHPSPPKSQQPRKRPRQSCPQRLCPPQRKSRRSALPR